jgi:mRNA interferase RelE/StbE
MSSGKINNILYAKSVKKDIKNIPPIQLDKIKKGIEELLNFPYLNDFKKLSNHSLADFRLRIGNYRVLFDIDFNKHEIFILKIGHRKDIYDK